MSAKVHDTAIVEDGARLGEGVEVGPFCTVGKDVVLGDGTRLVSHVVVAGKTTLGARNVVYPFASLGQPSPDRKYKGEEAALVVGDDNDIREYVTVHIGTAADKGETRIGSRNLLMAGSHVAHDCVVGDDCIFANYVQLAGHVVVEDGVVIGGLSGIHQRVRVGTGAIVGGASAVDHDVPPYANVAGERAVLRGLNLVGLRRKGAERSLIGALDEAFDFLFADKGGPLVERAKSLADNDVPEVKRLADFVLASTRGVTGFEDAD
ncbi:MAG: acyl-ACP--UDP-N-acetylglucosamine O-acyltransferase [Pseudomonadaceae bacterium]|nr:acyl-ACP--UDP-N-acetylglucosamine O-acyltransferase [Pseudomonadaceae bacterium]